jgi:small subunit ribosomal protein S6e
MARRRLLLSKSKGYNAIEKGTRRKKSVRGNTINQDVVQINMKVTKPGSKPIDGLVQTGDKGEVVKEEAKVEDKKEEKKEEQ